MENTSQKTKAGKKDCWFLVFVSIWILILNFVVRIAVVDGSSMYPTLEDGEIMVVWQLGYEPAAGDIVVIDTSETLLSREYIVKRIIATEGQTVSIDYDSNTVCVDGQIVDETYINFAQEDPMAPTDQENYKVYTVPEGCIFAMGDNRNHSADSRSTRFGMIPEGNIVGHVVSVF